LFTSFISFGFPGIRITYELSEHNYEPSDSLKA
jgi:hypothetical protein